MALYVSGMVHDERGIARFLHQRGIDQGCIGNILCRYVSNKLSQCIERMRENERERENENQRETNELRLRCCGLTQCVNQALVPNTLESLATTSLR